MDRRTVGIIATAATALLCGCPGLFGLCFGAVMALVGVIPGAEIDLWGSSDPRVAGYHRAGHAGPGSDLYRHPDRGGDCDIALQAGTGDG